MGDPKRIRKKYSTPNHPWEGPRIEEEKVLRQNYGLKNKKEIWKMTSRLKNYKDRAKNLASRDDPQALTERSQLTNKLQSLSLVEGTELQPILALSVRDLMDRRLQSVLVRKGLARSMKQARQFITHQHVTVSEKLITQPSYVLTKEEEGRVAFVSSTSLARDDHPERVILDKKGKAVQSTVAAMQEPAPVTQAKEATPGDVKKVPVHTQKAPVTQPEAKPAKEVVVPAEKPITKDASDENSEAVAEEIFEVTEETPVATPEEAPGVDKVEADIPKEKKDGEEK